MSEYDLHSNIDDRVALTNQDIITDVTTNGEIIDTSGFESIEFVIQSGAIADGVFAILLEEGDDAGLTDAATLSADETLGALTGFTDNADSDKTIRVGSIGKNRYQRMSLVSTSVTGNNLFSATAILGNPHTAPVAQ